jgi:hypothetical protein
MIEVPNKKIELFISMDFNKQNEILVAAGEKKVQKSERQVDFSINKKTTARDFIWHLKRIHHYWNCAGKDNVTPPLEIVFK